MDIEGALVQETPLPLRRSLVRKDIGSSESLADRWGRGEGGAPGVGVDKVTVVD